jgi:hypothetical protein
MKESQIKVIVVGIGIMGRTLCHTLDKKEGVEIAGAVDINPNIVGKDLGEVCKLGKKLGIRVEDDIKAVFSAVPADIGLYCTVTSVRELYDQVVPAFEARASVISTSEQLSFPWRKDPETSLKLDEQAKKYGVSILGTGVCPGLVPDVIPIVASAGCRDIEHIDVKFFGDVVPYGPTVWKGMGLGLEPEEYYKQLGKIVDIEFTEPPEMIAAALGWQLDEIKEENIAIVAEKDIRVGELFIKKGTVSGFSQTTHGYMSGEEVITSHVDGWVCCDLPPFWVEVSIEGKPKVKMRYDLIHEDGWTTSTMLVNMIPKVINACPGLVTMNDLQLPSAVMGDMRKFVL